MAHILIFDDGEGASWPESCAETSWKIHHAPAIKELRAFLSDESWQADLIIVNDSIVEEELFDEIDSAAPHVPILLMTCASERSTTIHSLQLGALSFIPSQAPPHEFRQVVDRILKLTRFSRDQQKTLRHCRQCSFEFLLDNDLSNIAHVVGHLRNVFASVSGSPVREQMRLAVAIEETLQNAIIHGNLGVSSKLKMEPDGAFEKMVQQRLQEEPYRDRKVQLIADFRPEAVSLQITDEGEGFDFFEVRDPTDPENLLLPFGRGLLLIRSFMDEVVYEPPGNKVTLRKHW
ncbi:MAG: ATP-binding protein [Rubinisphaera brasiliensis]|uniref:ATP-binding response regulator n=1 Tax=Rubinisphaera brasiliensis TaxID=119 RepID=UPI00391B0621